ncbi:MAG: choice-of-anchor X domain-containing protein [Coriobacteriia bacterium]|nr:choice-of-anchor X domain-containing protein [Coriobacteriia bacterium]
MCASFAGFGLDLACAAGSGWTIRASTDSSGTQGNGASSGSSISADGRYVVFNSIATNLTTDAVGGACNVYFRDAKYGTVRLVSSTSSGVPGSGQSYLYTGAISADGRYVVFESSASNLVPGISQGVYRKDMTTGAVVCVSLSPSGEAGNEMSVFATISGDGRYVAFQSFASNLVEGDTDGEPDVFIRDVVTGTTRAVSTDSFGVHARGHWYVGGISLSADGRYVAFGSDSWNLVPDDTNGTSDIFVKDVVTGTIRRVSTDASGAQGAADVDASGNSGSYRPSISADGRYVAFRSYSPSLVTSDTNGTSDIFVKDTTGGTIRRVSTDSSGAQSNGAVDTDPSISADGRYVSFESVASNLASGDSNGVYDVFVKDVATDKTVRVSTDSFGSQANGGSGGVSAISADGRYVAFSSPASNLVVSDTNGAWDVFVKDTVSGAAAFGADVVPPVANNPETEKPVLVLIAGLDSDTGEHFVKPPSWQLWRMNTPGNVGAPWDWIKAHAQTLGVDDIFVVPTTPNSREWPAEYRDAAPVIDSKGPLGYNIVQLVMWLDAPENKAKIGNRPIILVGHSYGGLIARSALALNVLRGNRIIGLIEYGSPNGGSGSADYANNTGINWSDATLSMGTGKMREWNQSDMSGPVGVPVVRFGGTYLPDALNMMTAEHNDSKALFLNQTHNGKPSDGMVESASLQDGFGVLSDNDSDFGGGASYLYGWLTHSRDMPGTRNLYTVDGRQVQELVPWGPNAALLPKLQELIADIDSGRVAQSGPKRSVARAAALGAAAETSPEPGSPALPPRDVVIDTGSATRVTVPLDGPASLVLTSAEGTPTVVVRDGADRVVSAAPFSETDSDGLVTTMMNVKVAEAGVFTLDVALPAGISGTVRVSGAVSGGARFTLAAPDSVCVGSPVLLTAQLATAAGDPMPGATLVGYAALDGTNTVSLEFTDDGSGVDAVAGDGLYTAEFTPPIRGRWVARAEVRHASAQRIAGAVVDVGAVLATVTGPVVETTEQGPGATLATFGVRVPLRVSEAGTYTVRSALTDASGTEVGVLTAIASLPADESTTLVAAVDASCLSAIAEGPLTIAPLHITTDVDGVDQIVGSGPGLTTVRSYSATDFYAFSISLTGPAANPSPISNVHFSGTALNTSSTVAAVEYTIDGGVSWSPATPTDGAFDSSFEDFTVQLSLPDYVYGILVRQVGSGGTVLPVEDWAGVRFTVDTIAPARVADLAAVVTTESGAPVARVSWLPADPPSDTASAVRYAVTIAGVEVAGTYDTTIDIPLVGDGPWEFAVTPVDAAGNAGLPSAVNTGETHAHLRLEYAPGSNGTLSGTTSQTVDYGTDGTAVTAVPAVGYHFVKWSDEVTANPRIDVGAQADIDVTAVFAIDTLRLLYAPGPNGTLSGVTSQTVDYDTSGTAVLASPAANYHFVEWSDGVTDNPRTDTNVKAAIEVTARFALDRRTVKYGAGPNGKLIGVAAQSVPHGGSGSAVAAAPTHNYHFVDWSDGVTDNPRTDTNVIADIDVTANFALDINVPECTIAPSIDLVLPGTVTEGGVVYLAGHAVDSTMAPITAYAWRSSIDGDLSTRAAFSTSSLSVGAHTIYFKAQCTNGVWSPEATAAVIVNAKSLTSLSAKASASAVTYGSSALISGTLISANTSVAIVPVQLETSTDGVTFTPSGAVAPSDGSGSFQFVVKPSMLTHYRVRFAGNAAYQGSESASVTVAVRAVVTNPVAPSVMYLNRAKTVTGYLNPSHDTTTGPGTVRIYRYRLVGRSWRAYGSPISVSAYSKYSVSMKFPYRGKWRIRSLALADIGHVGSAYSGYDTITVK